MLEIIQGKIRITLGSEPWSGWVPVDVIAPNKDQPRTVFDEDDLRRTAESFSDIQIQPILVIPYADPELPDIQLMIVDGERRWRGTKLIGRKEILVCYQPGINKDNLHSKSFAANFCRVGHTHADTARAIDKEYKSGKTYEQIARMVGKTAPWASNEHTLLKLVPELLELVDSPDKTKRIAMKVALILADLPKSKQLPLWEKFKNNRASAQFTKLRHCGDVRHIKNSRRNDDRYCMRIADNLVERAFSLVDIPRAMLKHLTPATLDHLNKQLSQTEAHIKRIRERLSIDD